MQKLLILYFLLAIPFIVESQEWVLHPEFPDNERRCMAVIETSDQFLVVNSNIALQDVLNDTTNFNTAYFYSKDGELQDQKRFGFVDDRVLNISEVIVTRDSLLLVVGTTADLNAPDSFYNFNAVYDLDIRLLKYEERSVSNEYYPYLSNSFVDDDGYIYHFLHCEGRFTGRELLEVYQKFDVEGNFVDSTLFVSERGFTNYCIVPYNKDSLLTFGKDIFLIAKEGLEFDNQIRGKTDIWPQLTSHGLRIGEYFYFAGRAGVENYVSTRDRHLIYKYNDDFQWIDHTDMGGELTFGFGEQSLAVTQDSQYLYTGTFFLFDFAHIDVRKYDLDFNVIWEFRIDNDLQHSITNVIATKDGGCILFGVEMGQNGTTDRRPLVMKFDKNGTLVSTSETLFQDQQAVAFPNPSRGFFQIDFTDWKETDLSVRVVSSDGAIVLQEQVKGTLFQKDLSHLSTGQYYYNVLAGNTIVAAGAWMKI